MGKTLLEHRTELHHINQAIKISENLSAMRKGVTGATVNLYDLADILHHGSKLDELINHLHEVRQYMVELIDGVPEGNEQVQENGGFVHGDAY